MPVVSRCPRCQGLLAGTGRRERCMRCGEMVVAVTRKLCSRCGRDVTAAPRLKNQAGEYFCQPCWLEVCETEGREPAYHCGECGGLFSGDEVYQEKTQYVCKTCFAARSRQGGDQAAEVLSGLAAAEESPETAPVGFDQSYYTSTVAARRDRQVKRDRTVLVLVLAGAAVLIIAITVLVVWLK